MGVKERDVLSFLSIDAISIKYFTLIWFYQMNRYISVVFEKERNMKIYKDTIKRKIFIFVKSVGSRRK